MKRLMVTVGFLSLAFGATGTFAWFMALLNDRGPDWLAVSPVLVIVGFILLNRGLKLPD